MHRDSPNLSSELIAAYQAMRPVLLREQRIRLGGWACLLVAVATGWAGGHLTPGGSWALACFIGIFCGGLFRILARPIQHRWRWLPVGSALLGIFVLHLTRSTGATGLGFRWPLDLLTLALAGGSAWWFSFRMPTQAEIIHRARLLSR